MAWDYESELEKELSKSKSNWNRNIGVYKLNDLAIKEIFAIQHEVNLERDKNGMPIPGTGRIITNDEKKMIFDYIIENNYPITARIYNIVLKGYVNGDVIIEEKSHKL